MARVWYYQRFIHFQNCSFNTDSISGVHVNKTKEQFGECLISGFCQPLCFSQDQVKYLKAH
jgi:hypothetical protein